jgi:hypothetical protein
MYNKQQKVTTLNSRASLRLQCSNMEGSFPKAFFTTKFSTKKIVKSRCYFCFFGTIGNYFKIKLTICNLILSFRYGCKIEEEFFLLTRVLT